MMKVIVAILILALGYGVEIDAQGPPIFTDTPIMLGLAGKGLRTFGRYQANDQIKSYTHVAAVPYNIGTRLQAGGILRYVSKNPDQGDAQSGFGDLTLFVKQQIFQIDSKGKTVRALLKITETFPTGNDAVSPALGAGVAKTGVSLVTGYITTDVGLYAEVGRIFVAESKPDRNYYNMAVSLPILPQVYPPQQVNLSVDLNGVTGPVGFRSLFLVPGIQWITGRYVLIEGGIPIPIRETVASERQKTNFAAQLGLRVLLF